MLLHDLVHPLPVHGNRVRKILRMDLHRVSQAGEQILIGLPKRTSGQNVGDVFNGLPVVFTDELKAFASASATDPYIIVGDLKGITANFPDGDDVKFKFDDTTEMTSDIIRVLGKVYAGIGVTAPNRFTVVKKPA